MMVLSPADLHACRKIGGRATIDAIIEAVAATSGVSEAEILGDSRIQAIVRARHLVMYIASSRGVSLSDIGRALRRDRTSVLNGIRREAERRSQ